VSNLTTSRNTLRQAIKIALIAGAAALMPHSTSAQSDVQLTQYFALPNYYNAGAIGTSDLLNIRAGSRLQWVGIDNAPTAFLVGAEMPFKFINKRFGVGLIMQQESMGLYSNMNLGAQIAYKQKLFKGTLSIGAQIGFIDQSFKGTDVYLPDDDDYHQSSDDAIPQQDIRGNALDVGFGLYYTHKLFWLGLSGTHLNSPSVKLNAESGQDSNEQNYEFQMGRTLYFIAGSNIPLKNTLFEVMPSMLVKTDMTFTTGELTLRGRYNKFITFGVGYRWKDAVYAVASVEIKGFYIGYSYDYATSAIAQASSGSHEIFAGYSLKLDLSDKNRHRHKSIRIM
jgi:type IX secretion system PorP/SprF family membrane protein